ncbi:hypothetical protein ACFX2H_036629 [Malus domestica]
MESDPCIRTAVDSHLTLSGTNSCPFPGHFGTSKMWGTGLARTACPARIQKLGYHGFVWRRDSDISGPERGILVLPIYDKATMISMNG